MKYFFEEVSRPEGFCLLGSIKGVKEDYNLKEGQSRAKGWPADAHYRMDDDEPDDIKLADFLESMDTLLVVSAPVRDLLVTEKVKSVEYLPVAIVNHKGRKEKAPYFVANVVGLQDCIDQKKTKFKPNRIDPELWLSVQNLTLDPARIDPDRKLFRAKYLRSRTVWREDLVQKVRAAGFTGIEFLPPDEVVD
jgi:uncharacterized protein DUF1629